MNSLTLAEKFWLMSNIQKDEQEEFEKFKTLIKYVRPEAFIESENEQHSVDFIESIEEKLGRKLTEEELNKIQNAETNRNDEDLDVIERV